MIDATHPFASRMSANAVAACRAAQIPLVVFTRPLWTREPGDRWIEVTTMEDAADALVTKNSGGRATYAKIEAARALGIEVVMVRRPPAPEAETLDDLNAVMAWIASHRRAP